jgi:hypothetical protein
LRGLDRIEPGERDRLALDRHPKFFTMRIRGQGDVGV